MKYLFRTFILLIVMLSLFGVSHAMGQFFFLENPLIGERAPEFELETLTKQSRSFTAERNKDPAIVFFWATWCPHCREQLAELNEQKEELSKNRVKLILVDLGERKDAVKAYMERNGLDLDVFLDYESEVSEKYAVLGVPTFYFIDKDGIVQAVEHSLPENYLEIVLGGL